LRFGEKHYTYTASFWRIWGSNTKKSKNMVTRLPLQLPCFLSARPVLLCIGLSLLSALSALGQTLDWVNQPLVSSIFGSHDESRAVAVDASGNTYVTGYFAGTADFDPSVGEAGLTSAGGNDIFIAKYDASGNYLWAKRMGGTGSDIGNAIALDGLGNVYVTGSFAGTADFDPSVGTAELMSAGGGDIFIAQYDASGNYLWAKRMGGTGNDIGNAIALDGLGNVHVTGSFAGTADFDPGPLAANLTGVGSNDIFIAKYDASGNYVWAKSVGSSGLDSGNGIAVDGSGNVHMTGQFTGTADFDPGAGTANLTSLGGNEAFIAKYDASGNYVWAKRVGGSSGDVSHALVLDGSGNVHVTGYFNGTADFDPGAGTASLMSVGTQDIFIAKYDASGNYVWAKWAGGSISDFGYGIALDGTGNVHVTGYFSLTADFDPGTGIANLTSVGDRDIFIAKYDASGNYLWAKAIGGAGTDTGYGIAVDGSSNVYATGGFINSKVDFDPGAGTVELSAGFANQDAFVVRLSSAGDLGWAIHLGYYGSQPFGMECRAIVRDASGNVYATGNFAGLNVDFDPGAGTANLSSLGSTDIFIAKYDASGNYLWAKAIGSATDDSGYGLALDGSGNVHLTGYFTGTADFDPGAGTANLINAAGGADLFIAKYDASGNYLWAKAVGGTFSDVGYGLAVDGRGNVYVTGHFVNTVDFDPSSDGTANLVGAGSFNIFIAQYDASGNYVWAKAINGASSEGGYAIALDGGGNVHITGYFFSTMDFDPGTGTANLTSAGVGDIFIAKYDASGNYLWAKALGGIGNDAGYALALDGSGNVYVAGSFLIEADFDPGAGMANLTAVGGYDGFVAKYDASGNYLWAKAMGGTGFDYGYGLALDGNGNVHVTGSFSNTVDFDPGSGTANLTSAGADDIFIAKYDASGNYILAVQVGSTGSDYGYCIAANGVDKVNVGGAFAATVDFAPGAGTANRTALSLLNDIFIAQYSAFVFTGEPDINLKGNNVDIADGDITPDATDDTDFGNVCLDGGTNPNTFTIENTGTADLTLSAGSITITGAHPGDFSLSGITLPATIAAGSSTTFIITFDPSVAGTRTATVNIASNDSDEGAYDFAVTGNGQQAPTFTACPVGPVTSTTDVGQCTAAVNYTVTATGSPAPTMAYVFSGATTGSGTGTGSGSVFEKGNTTVTVTATNLCGAPTCVFTVTVTDTEKPTITCPSAQTVPTAPGDCGTPPVTYNVTTTDNCASTATLVSGFPSGSIFPLGLNTVVWRADDAGGNSTTCAFTVTVGDGQNPSIVCPSNISRNTDANQCTALVNYTNPIVSDNCTGWTLTRTGGLASGSAFPLGTNMVLWEVTDVGGNMALCQFTVTVSDAQLPSIACPSNTVRSNDAGQCSAVVTYATPTATDNCSISALVRTSAAGTASGSTFPLGVTTVTWQASDGASPANTKSCSFTVTVNDTQLPTITCPSNQTLSTLPSQCVAPATYSVAYSDNCAGGGATLQSGLPSGSNFPKGISTMVWKATDGAGLTKTCSFRVTVNDMENPAILCPTVAPTATAVNSCVSAPLTYSTPTATDNCAPAPTVVRISGPTSGSTFPLGTTTVIWRAIDGAGRSSTCSFAVAVADATPPVISCPGSMAVTGSGSPCTATVGYTAPTATDNCGLQSLFLLSGQPSGSSFPAGATVNTWRALDNSGTSATCSFTVTVSCGPSPDPSEGGESLTAERDVASPPLRGGWEGLLLSPNPATSEVLIFSEKALGADGELTVYDAQGRLMWRQPTAAEQSQWLLTLDGRWPNGVYVVALRSGQQILTKRLVVSRL